jgi:hypothetical protein
MGWVELQKSAWHNIPLGQLTPPHSIERLTMNMKVLKFFVGSPNGAEPVIEGPVKEEITIETCGDVEKIKKESGPLVWLVKSKGLGFLRTMEHGIVDRGKKNKAVQLSRRLLGYKEVEHKFLGILSF